MDMLAPHFDQVSSLMCEQWMCPRHARWK